MTTVNDDSGFQLPVGAAPLYHRHVAPLMAPFVDVLVEQGVHRGQSVLDVACGTGFVTAAAAAALGGSGRLAAIDPNPAMVEFAATEIGDVEVDWRVASALDLPFGDGSFDSVLCQQGVQFFPDPAAGLAEMRRVTRPGGFLGATVFAPLARSPYLAAQFHLLQTYGGVPPEIAATAFPPGGRTTVRDWAELAGWSAVDVTLVERVVRLPSLSEHIPAHLRALPWSGPFFELPSRSRDVAVAEMEESLAEFRTADGGADVGVCVLLLTAKRPD